MLQVNDIFFDSCVPCTGILSLYSSILTTSRLEYHRGCLVSLRGDQAVVVQPRPLDIFRALIGLDRDGKMRFMLAGPVQDHEPPGYGLVPCMALN